MIYNGLVILGMSVLLL